MSVEEVDFDANAEALTQGLYTVLRDNNIPAADTLAGLAKDRFLAGHKQMMDGGDEPLKACVEAQGDLKFEFAEDLAQDQYGAAAAPAVPRSHRPSNSGAPVRKVRTRWTGLHAACQAGSYDVANALLSSEANANSRGNAALTPTHEAARQGNAAVLVALLVRGGNVYLKAHNDWTPLHVACQHGNAAATAAILDRGSDSRSSLSRLLDAKDAYGETPSTMCKRYKQKACALELKGHAARIQCESRQQKASAAKADEKLADREVFEEAEERMEEVLDGVYKALGTHQPVYSQGLAGREILAEFAAIKQLYEKSYTLRL